MISLPGDGHVPTRRALAQRDIADRRSALTCQVVVRRSHIGQEVPQPPSPNAPIDRTGGPCLSIAESSGELGRHSPKLHRHREPALGRGEEMRKYPRSGFTVVLAGLLPAGFCAAAVSQAPAIRHLPRPVVRPPVQLEPQSQLLPRAPFQSTWAAEARRERAQPEASFRAAPQYAFLAAAPPALATA